MASFHWIDDPRECQKAVDLLMKETEIGIDLEGTISVLQVTRKETRDPNHQVYLFDILGLGHSAFNEDEGGLRKLLESSDVQKIMWDVRKDYYLLFKTYRTRLENAYDLQVLYCLNYQPYEMCLPTFSTASAEVGKTWGPGARMQELNAIYSELGGSNELMRHRPLHPKLLDYCEAGVKFHLDMKAFWLNGFSHKILPKPIDFLETHADEVGEFLGHTPDPQNLLLVRSGENVTFQYRNELNGENLGAAFPTQLQMQRKMQLDDHVKNITRLRLPGEGWEPSGHVVDFHEHVPIGLQAAPLPHDLIENVLPFEGGKRDISRVIGVNGENVKNIENSTGASIRIDNDKFLARVRGKPREVSEAMELIKSVFGAPRPHHNRKAAMILRGQVKSYSEHRDPPFGFIRQNNGDPDLYFSSRNAYPNPVVGDIVMYEMGSGSGTGKPKAIQVRRLDGLPSSLGEGGFGDCKSYGKGYGSNGFDGRDFGGSKGKSGMDPCRQWQAAGSCSFGDRCWFLHK